MRLVTGAARARALTKSCQETDPLFAQAQAVLHTEDLPAPVVRLIGELMSQNARTA